jgi:hypothetical protein
VINRVSKSSGKTNASCAREGVARVSECHVLLFLWPASFLVLSGCLSFGASPEDSKSEAYTLAKPGAPWKPVDPGASDAAYRSEVDGAILGVNSVCQQYQDVSLEDLRETALAGAGVSKIVREQTLLVDGLPALKCEAVGAVDGVPFRLFLTVVRGRRCIYDFLYVANEENFAAHAPFYEKFVASFREGETIKK